MQATNAVHNILSRRSWLRAGALLAALIMMTPTAYGDAEDGAPTFQLNASGGYSVYKSKLVQSNDTSTTVAYGLGVYAGSEQNVGFLLNREASTFAFELNSASIAVEWQDLHIRYRLGPIYLGAIITSSSWLIKAPPDADEDGILDPGADAVAFLDATSTGYGANFGSRFPIAKRGEAYIDVTYSMAGLARETASDPDEAEAADAPVPGTREIGIGPRMVFDIGGAIGFSRSFKGLCGFKYRTYSLSVDGEAYAELHTTTYLGLGAGFDF